MSRIFNWYRSFSKIMLASAWEDIKSFAKLLNSWKLLTIIAKFSILDIFEMSGYTSENKQLFHTSKYSLILLSTHLDSCKQSLFHFPSLPCAPLSQSNSHNLLGRPWWWPGPIETKITHESQKYFKQGPN